MHMVGVPRDIKNPPERGLTRLAVADLFAWALRSPVEREPGRPSFRLVSQLIVRGRSAFPLLTRKLSTQVRHDVQSQGPQAEERARFRRGQMPLNLPHSRRIRPYRNLAQFRAICMPRDVPMPAGIAIARANSESAAWQYPAALLLEKSSRCLVCCWRR